MKSTAFKIMGMTALVVACASSPSIRDQIDTTAFKATGISIFQPVEELRLDAFNKKVEDLRKQYNNPLYASPLHDLLKDNLFQKFDYTQEDMKDREVYKMAMEDLKFDELDMSINKRLEAAKEKAEKPQKPVVISLDDSKSEKLIRVIPEDETGGIINNANSNQSSVLNNIKEIRANSLNKSNTSKKTI